MMKKTTLILLATLLSVSVFAQVRLSHINFTDSEITITNKGVSHLDIASYYFCNFPAYGQLSSLTVVSGNTSLGPGESVTLEWSGITGAIDDGELGLYSVGNIWTVPSALVDYVEWGSSGHRRSSVAITAGMWAQGDFVPGGNAIHEFMGTDVSIGADQWVSTQVGLQANQQEIESSTYPTLATNQVTMEFVSDMNGVATIYDATGTAVSNQSVFGMNADINVSDLQSGMYIIEVQGENGFSRSKIYKR